MAYNPQLKLGDYSATYPSPSTAYGITSLLAPPYSFRKRSHPGQLQVIWSANKNALWHKLSPYTDNDQTLTSKIFSDAEPFLYTYIDQQGDASNTLRKYETQVFPIGSAPQDVVRITKFMGSGRGIKFLATQLMLQTGNAFNETRIYNPTSPIVAAGMGLTFNSARPQRFIDAGGIAGVAGSLLGGVGGSVASAIFGSTPPKAPSGTLPSGLSTFAQNDSKGLLRAQTANTGKSLLETKWPISSNSGTGPGGLMSMITNFAKSLFANFIPTTQDGITIRSDEGTYGRMIQAGSQPWGDNIRFGYQGSTTVFGFTQRWIGGGLVMRKNNESPTNPKLMVNTYNNAATLIDGKNYSVGLSSVSAQVGVSITPSNNSQKPGYRYDDAHFPKVQDPTMGSDIMIGWSEYENTGKQFPSKQTLGELASKINDTLRATLDKIKNANDGATYQTSVDSPSTIIRPGTYGVNGYDRLLATTKKNPPGVRGSITNEGDYPLGVLAQYRSKGVRMVDNNVAPGNDLSLKLPSNGRFDALNTLNVLDKSKAAPWGTWEPHTDDLVAFYFYDVVNTKFIPFRATMKGISENGNASWDELTFINRADRVYSYAGFTRNLNVSFHIAIGSIVELAPTFQRLNYLTTMIKPANYTYTAGSEDMNRFMIPPMLMMTIGDLYKDQPVLIQTITTTVPDDASWETYSEYGDASSWDYLAKYITNADAKFGQLPRSIDVSLGLILLEKERAIAGGANFSHAPRKTDMNQNWIPYNTDIPLGTEPKKFGKSIVVNVV